DVGMTHDRTAAPLMITVHAPHWPSPQPNRGPCRPRSLRRMYSSGVEGSTSTVCARPFTLRVILLIASPSVRADLKVGPYDASEMSACIRIIPPTRPVNSSTEAVMARIVRNLGLIGLIAMAMVRPAWTADPAIPKFQVDPSWPKTLPNQWIFGQIGGIFVDAQDHIWINQRPGTLDAREKRASTTPNVKCCKPAPSVVEFDQEGNVVQAWGGPGEGYTWPANEHGVF